MKKHCAGRLTAALTLLAFAALSTQAVANDDGADVRDDWPSYQALNDCGQSYVRDSVAPTASGAQSRCAAALERRMKVVATMTRLSTPRMGGPTPEWEEQVKLAVAKKRVSVYDDFAKSVREWIAERKK